MILTNVQRWSSTVYEAIHAIDAVDPELVAVALGRVNLEIPQLVDIILGIIQRESAGNPNAVGDNGCSYGLMQVNWCSRQNPAGRIELQYPYQLPGGGVYILRQATSPQQLQDPYIGIAVGTGFFLAQLEDLEDVNAAILAYNAPTATRRWLRGEIPVPVNQSYLDAILGFLELPGQYFAELKKKSVALASADYWPA